MESGQPFYSEVISRIDELAYEVVNQYMGLILEILSNLAFISCLILKKKMQLVRKSEFLIVELW